MFRTTWELYLWNIIDIVTVIVFYTVHMYTVPCIYKPDWNSPQLSDFSHRCPDTYIHLSLGNICPNSKTIGRELFLLHK